MGPDIRRSFDRVYVRDLHLRCVIGINDWERKIKQDVVINMVLFADLSEAAASDNIDHTVDYKALTKRVITMVEASSFLLVERMADQIVQTCFEDPRVAGARVAVEKPGALRFSRSVGVEIERYRSEGS